MNTKAIFPLRFSGITCVAWILIWNSAWLSAHCIEREVTVSVYQGEHAEGDFNKNLAVVEQVTSKCAATGCHFLVFPECFLSGYESRDAVVQGSRGLDDPGLIRFVDSTKDHDTVVLVGMARKRPQGGVANSQLIIHRGKLVGWYDKVMLTQGDRYTLGFEYGTSVPVYRIHGVTFGIAICHDTSFPYVAMMAKAQGAEILFTPHNNEIDVQSVDNHRRWVRNCHIGLACQFKMVVARANSIKSNRSGRVGYGDSFILDPQGTPLAEADLFKTELISATITSEMFRSPTVWSNLEEAPSWLRQQLAQSLSQGRRPSNDESLKFWIENMNAHQFTREEMSRALGMSMDEVDSAIQRLAVSASNPPALPASTPLPSSRALPPSPALPEPEVVRILPYPGGRHPRLGFLDGAVMPQRETKVSVFPPWEDGGYVVADIPEAVFSNLGLIYLAHTHVPTLWDLQQITLPQLEWTRNEEGGLYVKRDLPNGISFSSSVIPKADHVDMELTLTNGTKERLTGLRVQNCMMLGYAKGFESQDNETKRFQAPFAIAGNRSLDRWVITAWTPIQRSWGNPPCPCLHADPQFPDCGPGETVTVRGWLSFYEGTDVDAELKRITSTFGVAIGRER
jgi:predicted amidohydrolase